MNAMRRFLLIVAILTMGLSSPVWAQTNLVQVRLTEPVTSVNQQNITLSAIADVAVGDVLYVDREAMVVNARNATTLVATVARGQMGTRADFHFDDSIVWAGAANLFYYYSPSGRCTAPSAYPGGRQPWINILTGEVFFCDRNVYGVDTASSWRGLTLAPVAAGRVPYTAIAYRTSRTSTATVITPAYTALLSDVLIASLTYSGPFEVFLPDPTGLLGKQITVTDTAGLASHHLSSTAGRTITIRGLFENGDNSKVLARWDEYRQATGLTSVLVGAGATTSFYVGITASSMYYWFTSPF